MRVNAHLMEMTAVNGMMNHYALLIYQMVWETAERQSSYLAVELGVSIGNSAVAILAGLDMAKRGHLYSYDIQECGGALDNVEKAGFKDRWIFRVSDSILAASSHNDESVDFLFIDTDHEYQNTLDELQAWTPKMAHRGKIVMHDTLSRPLGVGRAFDEFRYGLYPSWQSYNIDVCCGLGVLIKP